MTTSPYSVQRQRREQRHMRLVGLGYKDYNAYLRSSEWQRVKARYRASDQPQDCMCGATEELQLHHMTYERVGAEELTDLTLLCSTCHAMIHVLVEQGQIGLDFTGLVNERRAERYREAQRGLVERRGELAAMKAAEAQRREGRSVAARVRQVYALAVELNDPLPESAPIQTYVDTALRRLQRLKKRA